MGAFFFFLLTIKKPRMSSSDVDKELHVISYTNLTSSDVNLPLSVV